MDIFYLKKSEFLKAINRESLEYFSDNRNYASDDKYIEHLLGLFLTKYIAKHFYNISDLEIERKNDKPFFKEGKMCFSISHSKDVVLVAFNNKNIGVDVEYISERKNFKAIMERFGEKVENPTCEDFYRFWTLYEAGVKLNEDIKSFFVVKLEKDYMLSCVSADVLVSDFCVKKLICDSDVVDLVKEFECPKNCKLITSVE